MATGMATPYRRGPQGRSGRSGPFNPRSQSGGMPKRNGAGSYGPMQSQNVSSPSSEEQGSDDGFYSNVRMLGGVTQAVGRLVRVEVANGNIYEGILITVSKDFSLQVDQAKLLNKADGTMEKDVFTSLMFKKDDYISFKASEIDIRADTFLDSAISSVGRVNGQSNEASKVKTLVQWNDDSEDTGLSLEDSGSGSNGWDADEMFSTNAAKFNVESSYEESLAQYTTPLPKFKNAEEERRARQFAEESARQIESSDGYRQRMEAENNPTVDEETKYSSVIRDDSKPASDRYVPPARRQAPSDQGQRGPGGPSSQPPLPQREQRRERGDARQDGRWDRNAMPRGPHSMPPQPAHMSPHSGPPPQSRDSPSDRLNGDVRDRRQEPPSRNTYPSRPPAHHNMAQGIASQRVPPQSHPHALMPGHQPPQNLQQISHPMHPNPPQSHGRVGVPPPVAASVPPAAPSAVSSAAPPAVDKVDGPPGPQQAPAAHAAAVSVADKKSPREKDRQEKQVANLRQFHNNFKLSEEDKKEERGPQQADRAQPDRRPDHGEQESASTQPEAPAPATTSTHTAPPPTQAATVVSQGVTATSQGATPTPTPLQSQAPPAQTQGPQTSTPTTVAAESPSTTVSGSILNPLAMEFKPRAQNVQVATPTPSATPPAQGPRQSPGMMPLQPQQAPSVLMQTPYPTYVMQQKVLPMQANPHPQQQQSKPFTPKRAVVSVDPVALAAQNATGQPLQLAAQAATMQQQPYQLYQLPPGPQGYPQMVRVVQSHVPQGATMDPSQGASNQQQHIQQQLFMPQQPVPAHMPAQALSQPMPQPAHTQHMHPHTQHMSHASHTHSLPPVSQTQASNPHPSPSPVQHMGPGAPNPTGPQLNHHAQGAPPTSGTPQSMLYGNQLPGTLLPQGAPHGMPAHSVAQGPTPLHFMQHQMQAGVNLSQAGGAGSGGPAPAHMQSSHSGHMNQPQHVVVMPQPPPQAINQAPINPPHTHSHHQHQHAAAAAQFQQQIQGAASQMHAANMGPNQHLQLQGGVSSASMMPHNIFAMQPGMQAHSHHSHGHHHSHNQPHFQGQ